MQNGALQFTVKLDLQNLPKGLRPISYSVASYKHIHIPSQIGTEPSFSQNMRKLKSAVFAMPEMAELFHLWIGFFSLRTTRAARERIGIAKEGLNITLTPQGHQCGQVLNVVYLKIIRNSSIVKYNTNNYGVSFILAGRLQSCLVEEVFSFLSKDL